MIGKMTPIPANSKNFFGTASANMQKAIVRIVEGESTLPAECTPLGICDVELPPFLPKGSPVELVYQYNANQVLEVAVHAAGNETKMSIERNTGLAPHEIAQATASLAELTCLLRCSTVKVHFPVPLPDDPHKWDGWSKYNSPNLYERLCLDPQENPSNELIEEHCRELLRWWQKKLPLKNQPSNPHGADAAARAG